MLCSVLLLLYVTMVFSHEANEDFLLKYSRLYPTTQIEVLAYGSLVFGALIVIILFFHKNMNDAIKKILYFLLVAIVLAVTIYFIWATFRINLIAESKGPVHWHADYEIWICDKRVYLEEPKGLSNKQGVNLVHSHMDNRIHVEGVLLHKWLASLGTFFQSVGGKLSDDGLNVPTAEGIISVHDGDSCNEKPAKLYVFVNGKLISNPSAYVISPYEKVPPGDRIKIIFSEKSLDEYTVKSMEE